MKSTIGAGCTWHIGRMANRLMPLLALLILAVPLAAHAAGFVHASDRGLVDGAGRPFQMRGIGLGNWLVPEGYMFGFTRARSPSEIAALFARLEGADAASGFWTEFRANYVAAPDVALIAAAGFNTIRVPLHWALFMDGSDPPRFEGPGYDLLDRLVGEARAAGLKLILDLHAAPGGQTGVNHDDGSGYPLSLYVPRERRATIALWRELAARYHDEPAILGYDLLNEPISPYLDEAYLNPRLEPFYQDIRKAIREVDPNHLLILEGAQWASNFAVFGPPFDANLAYSFHEFWSSTRRDAIAGFLDFSAHYDVPVLLGESGELDEDWNARFVSLLERYGIGWSFWTYKRMGSDQTVATIPTPPGWNAIAAAADRPPDTWSDATLPRPAAAKAALDALLSGIRLANDRVNAGYLASLGLRVP